MLTAGSEEGGTGGGTVGGHRRTDGGPLGQGLGETGGVSGVLDQEGAGRTRARDDRPQNPQTPTGLQGDGQRGAKGQCGRLKIIGEVAP